jgi:hypothetical protein
MLPGSQDSLSSSSHRSDVNFAPRPEMNFEVNQAAAPSRIVKSLTVSAYLGRLWVWEEGEKGKPVPARNQLPVLEASRRV